MLAERPWILLAVAGYVLVLWIIGRARRAASRRRGISPERLAPFDHRGFLDELQEIYEAGLEPAGPRAEAASQAEAVPALFPLLGTAPAWLRPDVWEAGRLDWVMAPVGRAQALVAEGRDADVDALVEAGQETEIDQQLASLGVHFFMVRLYRGDLDGATAVLKRLPVWTRDRISVRVVDKHLAQLALLRGAGDARPARYVKEARKAIERAGGGSRYADSGTRALWGHLALLHGRSLVFEDLVLLQVDRAIRKGLSENRSSAMLYYELAHCCLWRGRTDEAVDHLARALYFAGGDPFYARPILDAPEIARIKPALVRQAQARVN
jgi:hypothetical protein